MKTYKVYVSNVTNFRVEAKSEKEAKEQVWEQLQVGFNYGWNDKSDFMKNVSVEKI